MTQNQPQQTAVPAHLAGELAFDLIRTLRLMYALRDRLPRVAQALEPATQPLLHRLGYGCDSRVTHLAASMHADVSTVSRYASQLASAGLIEKAPDPDDRRVQVLSLTDSGREALASLTRQREDAFARILHDWTPGEVTQFRSLLNRFADDLERDLTDQAAPASP